HLDTDYVSGGVKHHAKTAMSAAMIDDVKGYADQAKNQWTKWNNGRANASMDKIVVKEPIRSLTKTDDAGHYWVAPEDVAAQLDKYAPPGKYDSLFVVWNPASASPDIPICCAYGIGPQASTNGATYAAVPTAFKGGEAYVHEWLHGAGRFYRSHGLDVPDPHENRTFG